MRSEFLITAGPEAELVHPSYGGASGLARAFRVDPEVGKGDLHSRLGHRRRHGLGRSLRLLLGRGIVEGLATSGLRYRSRHRRLSRGTSRKDSQEGKTDKDSNHVTFSSIADLSTVSKMQGTSRSGSTFSAFFTTIL